MLGASSYSGRSYNPFARPNYQIKRTRKTSVPTVWPVTLDEAKAWLGITDTDSDDIIQGLIEASTDMLEQYLRRALITATYTLTLDYWFPSQPGIWEGTQVGSLNALQQSRELPLLIPALDSVTKIETFVDDGTATIYPASNYYIDNSDPNQYGRIILHDGASTPTNLRTANAMVVTYEAGYGAASTDVPYAIRQGQLRLIAYLFNQRGFCADGDGLNSNGAAVSPIEVSGAAGLIGIYEIKRL